MKILLTGASGYLGYSLASYLAGQGHRVKALSRHTQSGTLPSHPGITPVKGDLSDPALLEDFLEGCHTVIHLAAYTNLNDRRMETFYETNVTGTLNLLKASSAAGIRHFIFISSVSVFGRSLPKFPIQEHRLRLEAFKSPYELTKAMAENLVKDREKHKLPYTILNVSRIYGPGKLRASNGINRFILILKKKKRMVLPDRLEVKANYIYIDDLLQVIGKLVLSLPRNEQFIAGGFNHSYNDLITSIQKHNQGSCKIIRIPDRLFRFLLYVRSFAELLSGKKIRLNPDLFDMLFTPREADSSRLQSIFNYQPTPLDVGIRKTVKHLSNEY